MERNGLDSWVKMGENDTRHLGFGWYDLEKWSERNIRWTTNYGIIFLKNSLPGGEEETLEMEAYSHFQTEGGVWINGIRVGEFVIKPGEWQRLCFKFWNHEQVLKVTIKPEETFIPKLALKVRDNRTLGIAISEIGLVS